MTTLPPKPTRSRTRTPLVALLAAHGISATGNMMTLVAIPWFVLQETGSAERTGIVAFFATLPVVVAGPLGGVLADRAGHRRMSILADLASGATIVLVPLLHVTVGLGFWQLVLLVFLSGVLDTPGRTSRSVLIADYARRAGTPLERATGALDATERAARLVGAPLTGLLIVAIGPLAVLYVDAATFAVSALLVLFLTPRAVREREDAAAPGGVGGIARDLREGLAFLVRDRLLRAIVLMVLLTNMFDGASFGVVIPVFANQVLGDPVALGLLFAATGGGALTGAVVYSAIGHRLPRRIVFLVAFLVAGGPRYLVLATLPGLPIALVTLVVAGLAAGSINPILSAVELERVPPALRARVFGVISAGAWAAMPLGGLLGGMAIEAFGLRATLIGLGLAYLLVTLAPALPRPWREMDRRPEPGPPAPD